MPASVEAFRDDLFLIDFGIKNIVPIEIGIDMNVRRHRNNHNIVKDTDPHRFGGKSGTKDLHRVGSAVPIGIFENFDAGMRASNS